MAKTWFYVEGGRRRGPVSVEELVDLLLLTPPLSEETLVWREGLSAWTRAVLLPEVAAHFPPPPPDARDRAELSVTIASPSGSITGSGGDAGISSVDSSSVPATSAPEVIDSGQQTPGRKEGTDVGSEGQPVGEAPIDSTTPAKRRLASDSKATPAWAVLLVCVIGLLVVAAAVIVGLRSPQANSAQASSLTALGNEAAARGNWASALDHYLAASRLEPNDAGILANLGAVYGKLSRCREALPVLERSVALGRKEASTLKWLVSCRISEQQFNQAVVDAEAAVALFPDDSDTHYWAARALLGNHRLVEAREEALAALKRQPSHEGALGLLREMKGRLDSEKAPLPAKSPTRVTLQEPQSVGQIRDRMPAETAGSTYRSKTEAACQLALASVDTSNPAIRGRVKTGHCDG